MKEGKTIATHPLTIKRWGDLVLKILFFMTMLPFMKAGFVEVARRSPKRHIMRYTVGERGRHGLEQ